MFLHKKGARQPDALNPDNWAIDAYAFSIAASRVFMCGFRHIRTCSIGPSKQKESVA